VSPVKVARGDQGRRQWTMSLAYRVVTEVIIDAEIYNLKGKLSQP
jgi:hypothetical protein